MGSILLAQPDLADHAKAIEEAAAAFGLPAELIGGAIRALPGNHHAGAGWNARPNEPIGPLAVSRANWQGQTQALNASESAQLEALLGKKPGAVDLANPDQNILVGAHELKTLIDRQGLEAGLDAFGAKRGVQDFAGAALRHASALQTLDLNALDYLSRKLASETAPGSQTTSSPPPGRFLKSQIEAGKFAPPAAHAGGSFGLNHPPPSPQISPNAPRATAQAADGNNIANPQSTRSPWVELLNTLADTLGPAGAPLRKLAGLLDASDLQRLPDSISLLGLIAMLQALLGQKTAGSNLADTPADDSGANRRVSGAPGANPPPPGSQAYAMDSPTGLGQGASSSTNSFRSADGGMNPNGAPAGMASGGDPPVAMQHVTTEAQQANLNQPRTSEADNKLVMMAYSPWHANGWMRGDHQAGVTPDVRDAQGNLIPYDPLDPRVMEWERDQFMKAGVDTLVMDWSNNPVNPEGSMRDMEIATERIAAYYNTLPPGEHPKIAIMIGTPGNRTSGDLQQKAEQVRALTEKYPNVFQTLTDTDGVKKPLLLNYAPSREESVPWDDPSFNVVNMTGYADQRNMANTASWEQRGIKPTMVEGKVWVTVSSAHRGDRGWHDPNERQLREGGEYLERALGQTLKTDADIVFMQSWFEGTKGEESDDPEGTNDLIPSLENGTGDIEKVAQFSQAFRSQS